MQVPQKGGSPSQPEDKILAVTFTWLLDVKNIETQFHHHKMPTKDIDDRRIPILPTTPIDYIKGFRQYPMNFWLCTLLLFLVELGCAILAAPSPMLLETAVCRHH